MVGGIFICVNSSLQFIDLPNCVFTESIHFSKEFVESFVYCIKSSKVSVSECLLKLCLEAV